MMSTLSNERSIDTRTNTGSVLHATLFAALPLHGNALKPAAGRVLPLPHTENSELDWTLHA